jgi:hypothetical protein
MASSQSEVNSHDFIRRKKSAKSETNHRPVIGGRWKRDPRAVNYLTSHDVQRRTNK